MTDLVRMFRKTKSTVKNEDFIPEEDPEVGNKSQDSKSHSTEDLESAPNVFKESSRWRKSLRKLRWKRKDAESSSKDTQQKPEVPDAMTSSLEKRETLSKRWSYSVGEDEKKKRSESFNNNPVDDSDSEKTKSSKKFSRNAISACITDDEDFQSLFKEKRLSFNNDICFKDEFFRSFDKLVAPKNVSKQQQQAVSADDILLGNTKLNPEEIRNLVASSSYQLLDDSEEEEEQEQEPYALEDIDDILGDMNLRSGTSSFRSQTNPYVSSERSEMCLRSISDTLIRVRDESQYEEEAELALEDLSLSDQLTNGNTENVNKDPSYWGSSEWDQSSDDLDYLDSDKKLPLESKLSIGSDSTSKQNRVSKNLQSFRFWDRSSTKKKTQERAESPIRDPSPSFLIVQSRTLNNLVRAQLPPAPENLTKNQKKRRYILQSIIETENSYLDGLIRLESDYKHALLESKPQIVSSDVIEKMFFKVSEILQCHQLFQIALASSVSKWDEDESVGETFVASFSKSVVLECYGSYINNFSVAMELVRKTCVRKPQFLDFLRHKQDQSTSRVNLFGLMLKPVQRFPQFILLIQDLLKHTDEDHCDRLQLQLALTELEILTERLNQRKADDENRADLKLLLDNSNLKISQNMKDGGLRKLLKQGETQECEHNVDGLLEKMKTCSLALTSDMLICCSINTRRVALQRANSTSSRDVTYKLKWRVNLDKLQVYNGVFNHAEHTNREMLHSDFVILQRMSKMCERLHLQHEGLSLSLFEKPIQDLEKKIRQAEQTTRHPEHFSLTVHFPWKTGSTTRTFVFPYVSQKDDWLEAIKNAKLANDPTNVNSWFISDAAEGDPSWSAPLFAPSVVAKTLKVQCGHAFMQNPHDTLLWISCASGSFQSLVFVYYVTEGGMEKVRVMQVESSVRCIEHWNPNGDADSVWLGLESGSLLEYSADRGNYQALSEVSMPTESSVMLIKSHKDLLFVSLLEGDLLMYHRPPGSSDIELKSSIVIGKEPLTTFFCVSDQLWAFWGNNVVTLDIETFQTKSSLLIPTDDQASEIKSESPTRQVKLVTRVGCGLWLAFHGEAILNLYYLETLSRLQELNLSRIIRDFVLG